jgi:hypothetical protein
MAGSKDPAVFVSGSGSQRITGSPIELAYAIVAAFPRRICGMETSVFKTLVTGADTFEPGGECEFIVGSA